MKKYIDGEKLKYRMNGARESVESGKEAFELVAHWLEILPPEDVVPVVRCKYCKYFRLQTECASCEDRGEACGVCNKDGACVPSDGFCYYGRKNEKIFDKD